MDTTVYTVGADSLNWGRYAIFDGSVRIVGGYTTKAAALEVAARMTQKAQQP